MASRGWGKNKKGVLVNSQGKTALEVRVDKYAAKLKARKEKLAAKKAEAKAKASGTSSLSVSGGGGEAPATGKSRLGRLIDSIEANQKADVQNYRRVLKVADKANAMAGGKPGGQPSGNATRSQLPGTAEKKGRFSKAVSDLEAIDKADLKNAAKTYGATAALMGAAKKSTEKTAKGLSEGKTKLLQKASEGKTPAKPASKGSEEKIATQKTKKPSDMSAREMQKEYQQIEDKQTKLIDKLIEAGFSRVTMSEISRRRNENPLFKEYAELSDRAKDLTLEAEIRGGPGFRVRDLTSKHKNPYAKKPNKKISNRGD